MSCGFVAPSTVIGLIRGGGAWWRLAPVVVEAAAPSSVEMAEPLLPLELRTLTLDAPEQLREPTNFCKLMSSECRDQFTVPFRFLGHCTSSHTHLLSFRCASSHGGQFARERAQSTTRAALLYPRVKSSSAGHLRDGKAWAPSLISPDAWQSGRQ